MNTTEPNQTQATAAFNGTSPRVVQLAHALDRLPPGTYQLTIVKNDTPALDWNGEILNVQQQKIERFSVSRSGTYLPE